MDEAADYKIAELERELLGVQEMLYLVLDEVNEPVAISARRLKEEVSGDRMIDISMTEDEKFWVFSIKEVPSEPV